MGFVYNRQTDRLWMRGYFGAAGLLVACAILIWLLFGYGTLIRCDRPSDQCEVIELRKLGAEVTTFPLSAVRGASIRTVRNKRGESTGHCAVVNRTGREPLELCPLDEDEFVTRFNAYLKDPVEERYEAFFERRAVRVVFVAFLAFAGLVALLLGLGVRSRLRLGTAHGYGSVHGEGHWQDIDRKRRQREGEG